ncbi:hypothetical protein AAFC00_003157 [Neodothiora populina]|uniref:Uncharacterized protein n=1 Tax=Neodothiora populina TaxID=2781224 RepID=A0ABR3P9H2_9PEZI
MDQNEESIRMYRHYDERSPSALQTSYGTSNMAARFRHPTAVQSSSVTEPSQAFAIPTQGFMESSGYPQSSLQRSGSHFNQYTSAESLGYAAPYQAQQPTSQYNHAYFYGEQATPSSDQPSQDHMQRYQAAVDRHASIASTSSQYSIPTPQSQYFANGQPTQFPATNSTMGSSSNPTSFESFSYTQSSSFGGNEQATGQMLPPSSFGGRAQGPIQPSSRSIPDIDKAYETYQIKAKAIFTLVKDRRLKDTRDCLLHISHYLLGNAAALGLDKDDKSLYDERLKLWETFNNTWLTTLQAQLDLTRDIIASGSQQMQHPQSLLDPEDMEELGQELVKLCDGISAFGLVDYQMGVAEEEILELLIKCLDLISPSSEVTS